MAKERDQDDHIDWLLEKKKYEVCVGLFYECCKRLVYNFQSLILCPFNCGFTVTGGTDGCRDQLQKH